MAHIALFGGSFNPPHVSHQMVALWVLETQGVDEIWWIPTFKHPFDKQLVDFDHRLEMCRLAALALGPRTQVSDVERTLGGDSVTIRTVEHLRDLHPEHRYSLVIGADLVSETHSWHRSEDLRRKVGFIVVGRQGAAKPTPVSMPAVSSTEVRRAIAAGADVSAFVPGRVLDYILDHRLYQG